MEYHLDFSSFLLIEHFLEIIYYVKINNHRDPWISILSHHISHQFRFLPHTSFLFLSKSLIVKSKKLISKRKSHTNGNNAEKKQALKSAVLKVKYIAMFCEEIVNGPLKILINDGMTIFISNCYCFLCSFSLYYQPHCTNTCKLPYILGEKGF